MTRLLWRESLIWAHNLTAMGICEADLRAAMPCLSRSSSSCLGSSCFYFKRSPGSAEFWSQNNTWHFPTPNSEFMAKMSCSGFPRTHFPSLLHFLSAASYSLDREAWLQSEWTPLPHECFRSKLAEFITSTERWKGMEWAKTLDFSCRTLCMCRQDGICKHTWDYPRCQLQQRASKFVTRKGRVSAACSPKSRSGHSGAGSAESLPGLTSCQSAVEFTAPCCGPKTELLPFFSPTLDLVLNLLGTIHRVYVL